MFKTTAELYLLHYTGSKYIRMHCKKSPKYDFYHAARLNRREAMDSDGHFYLALLYMYLNQFACTMVKCFPWTPLSGDLFTPLPG